MLETSTARSSHTVRIGLMIFGALVIVVAAGLLVVLPHFARLIDYKLHADRSTQSFTQTAVVQNDSWWWDEKVTGISAQRSDVRLLSTSIPGRGTIPSGGQIRIMLRFQVKDCTRIKPGPVTVAVHLTRAGLPHTESLSQEGFDFAGDALTACGLTSP